MTGACIGGGPGLASGAVIAVAIAVIAVPAGAAIRIALGGCIIDEKRLGDVLVVGRFEAQAHQFEEARVNHAALIDGGAAVAEIVADGGIGVAGLGEPDVVGMIGEWAVGGHVVALDGALPVIGYAEPDVGALRIAVDLRDIGRRDQTRDLCRDG